MSSNKIVSEYPDNIQGQNGEAVGRIHGTLTNLKSGITHNVETQRIWRDTDEGKLRFYGVLDDPEAPGKIVVIGLQLSYAWQPDGKFNVGDQEILYLGYRKYVDLNNPRSDVNFLADSGGLAIHRKPQDRIHGWLQFQTLAIDIDGDRYGVDVDYDIGAP